MLRSRRLETEENPSQEDPETAEEDPEISLS